MPGQWTRGGLGDGTVWGLEGPGDSCTGRWSELEYFPLVRGPGWYRGRGGKGGALD